MKIGSESQFASTDVRAVLITRLRFMGDVILTTPAIRAIRKRWPHAKVAYLAETPYTELLEHNPNLNEIFTFDRRGFSVDRRFSGMVGQAKLIHALRRREFDLAIDLLGNPRSAWLTWLSGARIRIGGDFRGRRHLYSLTISDDGLPKTAIEFHLMYLTAIGVNPDGLNTEIVISPQETAWAKNFLKALGVDSGKKMIGVHVGASWPAKRWLPERFAKLAKRLVSELGVDVVFTCGPGEENLVESVRNEISARTFSTGLQSLRQLAAIIAELDVYISNDCGPLHIAPAVNTNAVGIFGPGEPEIWFPYDETVGHRVVHNEIDCSRCHRDLCEKMDCMKTIQVENVMQAAKESLAKKCPSHENAAKT